MTPFATPALAVMDGLRLVIVAWGFLLVGMQLRLRPLIDTTGHRLRLVAVALALFVLTGSRVTNLGAPITWQLPVTVVVFALITASTFGPYRVDRHG